MIDLYCERTGPEFWAEPLNAVTNAAFLIAAAAAFFEARRGRQLDLGMILLAGTVFVIGLGSFAFHTLATPAASLADTLPILGFQLLFLWFYPARILGWLLPTIMAAFVVYAAIVILFATLPQAWLNGSLSYFPALLFLAFFGALHRRRGLADPYSLLTACGLFIVSLTFRSLDNDLCMAVPTGIHFLWHVCNAGVLYLVMRSYWRNVRSG